MSEVFSDTSVENFKGILQQYCQQRALGDLTYETDQRGTPNEPCWIVTVKYGVTTYTTPTPIRGSKRWAEKMAAKQVLEQIESHQEAFLAGNSSGRSEVQTESTELSLPEPLHVPTELVTTALGIANHRLNGQQRGARYRDSVQSRQGNRAFAQNLADLTMEIVRAVANAADAAGVKFGNASQPDADE